MIVSAVLALAAAGLAGLCHQQRNELLRQKEQEADAEALRQEVKRIRNDNARRRREIAALHRALEAEQEHSDDLELALEEQRERTLQAEKGIEQADARRIETEKEASAGRMRAGLLERQLKEAHEEQLAQEQLYQDIIRERDETIAKLQEGQQKRRPRRKPGVLDQQITLNDILKGA